MCQESRRGEKKQNESQVFYLNTHGNSPVFLEFFIFVFMERRCRAELRNSVSSSVWYEVTRGKSNKKNGRIRGKHRASL